MHVSPVAVRFKSRACLAFSFACLLACQKKNDAPPPPEPQPILDSLPKPDVAANPAASDSVPQPAPVPPAANGPLAFATHPPAKAYPGREYVYRPALTRPGPFRLSLINVPDSSMRIEKDRLAWTPGKEGRYPVTLEALIPGAGGKGAAKVRQEFAITVAPVLALALKPLPPQVNKGDSVAFDLSGSVYPAWAAPSLTVRFDYDGDGAWDTEALPLAANLFHRRSYASVGRFKPRVEAHYKDLEVRRAEGAIAVVSSVTTVLKISPDTVEPGGAVSVDASGSKGDGALVYSLDLDGDGKADWIDSASGNAVLKAPGSGVYRSVLTARNPMGQEGKAEATLRVNGRTRLDVKVKNPKENMAAAVEIKARAKDPDDSLIRVRVNYTGDANGWETRTAPADSVAGPREWWLRFKHVYGKVGKYTASVCVLPADGREACKNSPVEIFNAPPVCRPGPDLRATLGKPLEIDGSGVDPDGSIVKWEWDLDNDGKYDLVSPANGKFQYTFSKEGVFPLLLRVTTADGATATGTRKVEVRKKWKG